jgi:hypothetical protein
VSAFGKGRFPKSNESKIAFARAIVHVAEAFMTISDTLRKQGLSMPRDCKYASSQSRRVS